MAGLLQSLFMRSSQIQQRIEEESRARAPNWIRLLRLKKMRLKIKDRIRSLMYRSDQRGPEPSEMVYVRW